MAKEVAFNSSPNIVTIDEEGRQIGGNEWGVIDTDSAIAANAIDAGTLILIKKPKGEMNEQVRIAFESLEEGEEENDSVSGSTDESKTGDNDDKQPKQKGNKPKAGN